MKSVKNGDSRGINTRLTHLGNRPSAYHGFVNPPIVRASTVLFPDCETMESRGQKYTYGTHGTPTTDALCDTLTDLENAAGTVLMPSGLAALTVPLLIFSKTGGHILIVDSLYSPNRRFCDDYLVRLGMEVEYFPAPIDAHTENSFAERMRPNTCVVMLECPASNSFEMMDVARIASLAHESNPDCVVMLDNTWATPLFFRPLDHGVDISIQALTKYPSGHSDVLMGSASANAKWWDTLHTGHDTMGICVGGDDAYLVLRGIRTMGIRMERQQRSALEICDWLQSHPMVSRVLYPALPDDPGYDIWHRHYDGAAGLFSFVLKNCDREQGAKFLNALALHGLGFSWAGYESLAVMPNFTDRLHDLAPTDGTAIRIQVGLEDVADLIADLERGFNAISSN